MKIFKTSCKILILILLSVQYSEAQTNDQFVTLSVDGIGKTQETSIQIALRSAIEQAYGAFISSKTEMLDDQVIMDQMSSVSSGNIQSYEIINKIQLPDGNWATTLKAKVSINKLSNFVISKGGSVELKGSLFALNVKQNILNEQGEQNIVYDMVSKMHEIFQEAFDFTIHSEKPQAINNSNINWTIPLQVDVKTNANYKIAIDYLTKTIKGISLTEIEAKELISINKKVYTIHIWDKEGEIKNQYILRNGNSLEMIKSLCSQMQFYYSSFQINTIENNKHVKTDLKGKLVSKNEMLISPDKIYKLGLTSSDLYLSTYDLNETVATHSIRDVKSIDDLSKIEKYEVTRQSPINSFKQGGLLVSQHDYLGIVVLNFDLPDPIESEVDAEKALNSFSIHGYKGWKLPTQNEMASIYSHVAKIGLGNLANNTYLSAEKADIQYNGKKYNLKFYFDSDTIHGLSTIHGYRNVKVRPIRKYLTNSPFYDSIFEALSKDDTTFKMDKSYQFKNSNILEFNIDSARFFITQSRKTILSKISTQSDIQKCVADLSKVCIFSHYNISEGKNDQEKWESVKLYLESVVNLGHAFLLLHEKSNSDFSIAFALHLYNAVENEDAFDQVIGMETETYIRKELKLLIKNSLISDDFLKNLEFK